MDPFYRKWYLARFIDLKGWVTKLQAQKPDMLFLLEMITRDPLKIPVFQDKYWASFNDAVSPVPAHDLARVLEIVRTHRHKLRCR